MILKEGDKVRHAKYENYGVGEVRGLSKSGKKLKVHWPDCWFSAYYDPSSLQKVEEAKSHE